MLQPQLPQPPRRRRISSERSLAVYFAAGAAGSDFFSSDLGAAGAGFSSGGLGGAGASAFFSSGLAAGGAGFTSVGFAAGVAGFSSGFGAGAAAATGGASVAPRLIFASGSAFFSVSRPA